MSAVLSMVTNFRMPHDMCSSLPNYASSAADGRQCSDESPHCQTDKRKQYFVCHKFLPPCNVHKDRKGTENDVMSIPASYREVPIQRQALLS